MSSDVTTATSDFDGGAFGAVRSSNKTSYVIQAGDSFDISYEWQDNFNWNDGLDEVRFVVFATDNDALSGGVVWSSVMDSGISTANSTYETATDTSTIVGAGAVGKRLFVNVFGFQNNGALSASTGFARIDNISVTAVPEPGTYALIAGLLALGSVMIRRRK